ncbi:GNAT family N-acetyltransferase [Entomohabitans teleogrylli]|uniref:GNAT family N-acetyltransferase n=1 Tax=Entomohabitans teleogrylli TaxID=1384589 RepID=UPI00073D5D75|nr:GNAT family N-acetyltransferase [Entomohabitans teleogrylli]
MIIRHTNFTEIVRLHQQIPELFPLHDSAVLAERIGDKRWIGLLAEIDGATVGYHLGYWLNPTHFYFWLGGVLPAWRRHGVASHLLDALEQQTSREGAHTLSVKSMNRYPGMLIFLIRRGYQIDGFCGAEAQNGKIHFTRRLPASGSVQYGNNHY